MQSRRQKGRDDYGLSLAHGRSQEFRQSKKPTNARKSPISAAPRNGHWSIKGHMICFRHGAHCSVPHNVMIDRVAAEFGLDPTEVALKNDGCRGHDWDWVTRYQKENGFPQRWSLKEVIDKGKEAIGWDKKWHAPGTKKLPNGKMHGLGFMEINEWTCQAARAGDDLRLSDASQRHRRDRRSAKRYRCGHANPARATSWLRSLD